MEYTKTVTSSIGGILLFIWAITIIIVPLLFLIYSICKGNRNKPLWLTVILVLGEALWIVVMGIAGLEKTFELLEKAFVEFVPSLEDFTIGKFIPTMFISIMVELGAIDLFSAAIDKKLEPIQNRLFNSIKHKPQIDIDVTKQDYEKKSNINIYGYYARLRKRKNEYENETIVPEKTIEQWICKIKGKETEVILAKILEKSDNTDGTIIQLEDNGEKRTLFMTGDESDKNESKHSQANANKRALQRFENMKARGFLEGDIDHFYITLQGKEYVLEKNSLALLPPKLDSNEQSNTSEPIRQ